MEKRTLKIIYISIAVFFVLLFFVSLIYRNFLTEFFGGELKQYGLLSLFLSSLLLEGIPQYVAPQLLAFNAALLGFGFFESVGVLYLGSIVGSIVGFEVGCKLKHSVSKAFLKEKTTERIQRFVERRGKWAIFLTSISPLPYIPLIFGVLHFKRKDFLLLGVLPRIIFFTYMAAIAFAIF